MNSKEKYIARILFKNKILTSNGQAFEDLFVSVMQHSDPGFIPVKPQGNIGDRKNDGYNKNLGKYYQVFAPENPETALNDAVKKLSTDFAGLKEYWPLINPINEYHFVFNDKYHGTNPTIEKELSTIKTKNNLNDSSVILCKHLEELLFTLPDDVLFTIIGNIPDPTTIDTLPYSVVNEVINHILEHKQLLDYEQILKAPEFEEKIKFNGLSDNISALLTSASYHVGTLESYFRANSAFVKQDVRDALNDMYRSTLEENYGQIVDDSSIPDRRFMDILRQCSPTNYSQEAALVIMAYFFESCDIFKDPI